MAAIIARTHSCSSRPKVSRDRISTALPNLRNVVSYSRKGVFGDGDGLGLEGKFGYLRIWVGGGWDFGLVGYIVVDFVGLGE